MFLKVQNLFEIFYNITNVTFDQLNASLLNKTINLINKQKIILTPNF